MTLGNFLNTVAGFESRIDKIENQISSLDDKFSSKFKALNDKFNYQTISQRWMFDIPAATVLDQLVINYTA